jgi:Ala-tRNA(Pro) deacylase
MMEQDAPPPSSRPAVRAADTKPEENLIEMVRQRCQGLFEQSGLPFAPHVHEPVLDYETAAMVRKRFDLTGVETKSLFLRAKSGRYLMFVTLEGERLDRAQAQQALGEKVSIASGDELQAETGCVPGCAVPLGLPCRIALLIDPKVETAHSLIFSPGPPTETLQVSSEEWARLIGAVDNPTLRY